MSAYAISLHLELYHTRPRYNKGRGSRRDPCRLASQPLALLRVGRDHDLEEELVNARHRRDDQLALFDLDRRL